MLQDEPETRATLEIVPNEVRMHIASYLDTQSLCFFAATSRRCLGNALAEVKQRQRHMLAQMFCKQEEIVPFAILPRVCMPVGRISMVS